VDFGSFVI